MIDVRALGELAMAKALMRNLGYTERAAAAQVVAWRTEPVPGRA